MYKLKKLFYYLLIPAALISVLFISGCSSDSENKSALKVMALKYGVNDISPVISAKTMKLHHDVHYRGYVTKSNRYITEFGFDGEKPYELLKKIYKKDKYSSLYNNLGQALNHELFFQVITPEKKEPKGKLLQQINKDFGSYDKFKNQFQNKGSKIFGSGWVWLAEKDGKLEILATSNADNPYVWGYTPIIGIDVWEHAYYLDYQNKRGDYLNRLINNSIDWDYAGEIFNKYQRSL